MKRIRVGIIGQGRSGRNIHRHLIDTQADVNKRFELVAVADPIVERHGALPDTISVSPDFKAYTDYKETSSYVTIEDEEAIANMEKMLDYFDDCEDITAVYHNWEN